MEAVLPRLNLRRGGRSDRTHPRGGEESNRGGGTVMRAGEVALSCLTIFLAWACGRLGRRKLGRFKCGWFDRLIGASSRRREDVPMASSGAGGAR